MKKRGRPTKKYRERLGGDPEDMCAVRVVECPERQLWAAVLKQAVEDILWDNKWCARTAQNWVLSPSMRVGSFLWICMILNLEPAVVRSALYRRGAWQPRLS